MAARQQPDYATDYGDTELACRYPNHHWKAVDARRATHDRRRVAVVTFKCPCHNERVDVIGTDGERISSKIRYKNPDYLVRGEGRIDRAVWRREFVARTLNGQG